MRKFYYTLIALTGIFAVSDDIELKLNEPTITKRSATCAKGGKLKTDDITIYAKNFDYHEEDGEKVVTASGNLLISYSDYFMIGDSITYNFKEKRGTVINAVATTGIMLTGGKELQIFEDGSLEIKDAFITADPQKQATIELTSPLVTIDSKTNASTKTVVGRFNGVPFMWLPSYGTTLNPKYEEPPTIDYGIGVENNQMPAIYGRFKMYDNQNLQAYARLEYRFLTFDDKVRRINRGIKWYDGLGGAFDLDYKSDNKKFSFQTRNFVTYSIVPLDINPYLVALRYRLQGLYKGETEDERVETKVQWDYLSDRFIRKNFKPKHNWVLKTLENNEAYVKYRSDPAFVSLYAKPRLNKYRGFKQELPSFNIAVQPIELFGTKIYMEQTYNTAYLNYLYAEELRDAVPDFNAGRISTIYNIYRPFNVFGVTITPRVGFDGIFYSNNQNGDTPYLAAGTYGGDITKEVVGEFDSFDHYIKPYIQYNGYTPPTSDNSNHFVFSRKDGYAAYNQIIYGLKNEIYFHRFPVDTPTFAINARGMTFIGSKAFTGGISKGDLEFLWHYPRMEFGVKFGWNFQKNTYDFTHVRFGWTINDYFAVSSEFRSRGRFWWRKNNHESFIVDYFRTIADLQETPLSNARYCFVNKAQLQLSPLWVLQLENNVGKTASYTNDAGIEVPGDNQYYIQTKANLFMIVSNTQKFGASATFTNANKENAYSLIWEIAK
ncbi:hypothetical protein K0U07_04265 [bacterium]|nr:hypothetical protein [bacterium]